MLSNAAVAFALNVAAVFLIGTAGGLVLTLAGVFKVNSIFHSDKTLAHVRPGYPPYHLQLPILRKRDHADSDFG